MAKQTEKQRLWKQKHYQKNKQIYISKQTKRREEIREYLNNIKKKCIVCPEVDVACLEFHHVNPNEKSDELSKAIDNKWGNKRIDEEVAKCVVICSNCHRKLHYYNLTIEDMTKNKL